jgi:hypothetical protein
MTSFIDESSNTIVSERQPKSRAIISPGLITAIFQQPVVAVLTLAFEVVGCILHGPMGNGVGRFADQTQRVFKARQMDSTCQIYDNVSTLHGTERL